jgi:chromosome partitioning protein
MDAAGRTTDSSDRHRGETILIKAVISNQRGGVGKTTTALTLARYLADKRKRVLVVDTDPQGSIQVSLGLKPSNFISHFIGQRYALKDCVVPAHPSLQIDVICSNRETVQAEAMLMGAVGREQAFVHLFTPFESEYDAMIFDVAPSVTLLQTCAMVYCGQAIVPVDMDPLSFHGAVATHELAKILNELIRASVHITAILPTQVNQRLQMTEVILKSLHGFRERTGIPILSPIRTDTSVAKATKQRQFLQDFDPTCKAVQDYTAAFDEVFPTIEVPARVALTA